MRTLVGALARLVELDEHDLVFRHDHQTGEWTVGTADGEGSVIHAGHGATASEAAWALAVEVERAAAWAREYFARERTPVPSAGVRVEGRLINDHELEFQLKQIGVPRPEAARFWSEPVGWGPHLITDIRGGTVRIPIAFDSAGFRFFAEAVPLHRLPSSNEGQA